MSSRICFARGMRKHRLALLSGMFLSVAFWIAAASPAHAAANPAGFVAQDSPALRAEAPVPPAKDCTAASGLPGSGPAGSDGACRPPETLIPEPLIVIGFMGGRVRADNLVHREALLTRDLDRRYPVAIRAMTFANHDEGAALRSVLKLLDTNKDGRLSKSEKNAARIILFGHSWGASEAINLAQELDRREIPVLLTIQVDSVRKHGEHDGRIPANVREAINFYQTEGVLHGRRSIRAIDPTRTKILGSYESTYKRTPVSCVGFPWFARTFMKQHIEIENDAAVWDKIAALIVTRSCGSNPAGMGGVCEKSSAAAETVIGPASGRSDGELLGVNH